jgi:hypothetical protein
MHLGAAPFTASGFDRWIWRMGSWTWPGTWNIVREYQVFSSSLLATLLGGCSKSLRTMWFSHQLVYTTVRLLFDFVITSASGLLSIFRELVGWSCKWTSKIMWFKVGYLISSSFNFWRALVMDQNRFSDFCRTMWSWVYLKPYPLVLSLKNQRTTQHWSMS